MRIVISLLIASFGLVLAADPVPEPKLPDGTERGLKQIAAFRVPAGLKVELFAAEPMLGSPVAIGLDERNRVFVAEEYRFNRGTQENRNNPALQTLFFLEDDLQINSLEDRRRVFQKWAHKFPGGMEWYTKHGDQIRLLEDTQGRGKADKSTIFAGPFHDAMDGLAAGVLAHNGTIYVANIPSLYAFHDLDNSGRANKKHVLHTGFGVNLAFLGHDLHGLIIGPDGKLYFTVGDRGFNVTTHEGKHLYGPRTGGVFRCNLDGSELELVHRGLRNPQELAFDQYGNLFADDNNCDKGDHGRLVYVVEGGESGWNMAYQTIPPPYMTGPWFAERLWHLQHPGQAAYIVPPVGAIGSGPSGFLFTSGTALPSRYENSFIMCNYVGNGGLEAFKVKPQGASFEIDDYHDFMKPIRATDAEFGYDGKLYISDFVDLDWTGKSLGGRLYTLFDPKKLSDPSIQEVKKLFAEGFENLASAKLVELLNHADQRVRLRAQFTLAKSGSHARQTFRQMLVSQPNSLGAIHAIWGLGQIARHSPEAVADLVTALESQHSEVRAQAAKVIGECPRSNAGPQLVKLLNDAEPRVRFFAAQSLGKLQHKPAIPALIELLRQNNNQDVYLRHAASYALSRMQEPQALQKFHSDPSAAVRLGLVLVYRHTKDDKLAEFLDDAHPEVRIEAARAIHDLPLEKLDHALAAQLPKLLQNPVPEGDPLTRRALHAAYRIGTAEQANAVLQVAMSPNFTEAIRLEALGCLKDWSQPPPRDRVTGFWRPLPSRDTKIARKAVESRFENLLRSSRGKLLTEVVQLAVHLGVKAEASQFVQWAETSDDAALRVAALNYLDQSNSPQLTRLISQNLKHSSGLVRSAARSLSLKRDPKSALTEIQDLLAKAGPEWLIEQQSALADLGRSRDPQALKLLESWAEKFQSKKVPAPLQLDVLEALKLSSLPKLQQLANQVEAQLPREPMARFQMSLVGGNAERGRDVFVNHTGAQCIRCHKIGDLGGNAGPELTKLASRYPEKTREFLLESITMPSAKIAPGYASITLSTIDGKSIAGTLLEETPDKLRILTPEGRTLSVPVADVESRTKPTSPMPAADRTLSLWEMRDLIEFLANLK